MSSSNMSTAPKGKEFPRETKASEDSQKRNAVCAPTRIGILTFHHVWNYGALLQAACLRRYLTKEGNDVAFIDYRPRRAIQHYLNEFVIKQFPGSLKRLGAIIDMSKFVRNEMVSLFPRSYLYRKMKTRALPYDVIICGSDEIWNIRSIRGFDRAYFLEFFENSQIRKVSYATSFGNMKEVGPKASKEIAAYLEDFDAISVRDSNSQAFVKALTGKEVPVTADPSFLIDINELIEDSQSFKEPYILLYAELTDAEGEAVQTYARRQKLKIVSVWFENTCADRHVFNASVGDWLNLIKNAEEVVSTYYHGVLCAIHFGRRFYAFERSFKNNKIKDVLDRLGLKAHSGGIEEFPQVIKVSWQDAKVSKRIAQIREFSRLFLQKTLAGPIANIKSIRSDKYSTLRTEHIFDHFITVTSLKEMKTSLAMARKMKLPVYILGNGSNTLFEKRRIQTMIIKNEIPRDIIRLGGDRFEITSSVTVMQVLQYCYKNGLDCFYYLASVPATIGGALAMNAGRGEMHKLSIYDFVEEVKVLKEGRLIDLKKEGLSIGFRKTPFTGIQDTFIVSAVFRFVPRLFDSNPITDRLEWAKHHQDLREPNCGSVFAVSCPGIMSRIKGMRLLGARYSEKTTNWILNNSKKTWPIIWLIRTVQFVHKIAGKKVRVEWIRVK